MEKLLSYSSIKKWISNFPDRPNTKKNYLLRLGHFLEWIRKDPDTLINDARINPNDTHDQMKMFYNMLISNGKSSKTAVLAYQCLRSFYKWNDVILGPAPRGFKGRVEYGSPHLLTPDEIAKMVDASPNIRDKCIIIFLSQSGQRNGILTALRYKHVKQGLENNEYPLIIEVSAILRDSKGVNVNKLGETYRFAVGSHSIQCLKKMVDERIRNGEAVDQESWLFRSYSQIVTSNRKNPVRAMKSDQGKSLTSAAIRDIIHYAALRAEIQGKASGKRYEIHPHIFRRYWNMRMQEAGLSEDLRDFMLGHKLPYGGAYSKWYPDTIRKEWIAKNIEKYLSVPAKSLTFL